MCRYTSVLLCNQNYMCNANKLKTLAFFPFTLSHFTYIFIYYHVFRLVFELISNKLKMSLSIQERKIQHIPVKEWTFFFSIYVCMLRRYVIYFQIYIKFFDKKLNWTLHSINSTCDLQIIACMSVWWYNPKMYSSFPFFAT